MLFPPSSMLRAACTALLLSAVRAEYAIDNLSFGHKEGQPLSPNLRAIPHFHVKGDGWDPEILSDRILLTPPWPGNRRGAVWSEDPLHHKGDWVAELHFRVSGMERGQGNLQLWYVKDSQKDMVPTSLYTAPKFDGLVLVIDQYEGRGGSIRGFLNDGNIDIKAHSDPDTLAFGQCSYAYRNLGRLSVVSMRQANGVFEVLVDGHRCFHTTKVQLPEEYHFGISASSAENPDSFEVHKFVVSTTNAYTREEPKRTPPSGSHEQQRSNPQHQEHPTHHYGSDSHIPKMLEDVFAANIQSQQDQFADVHNRIQIINHHIVDVWELLDKYTKEADTRYEHLMSKVVSTHDQVSAMLRNLEKVERTTMETLRDLESKDFKDVLNQVHESIERNHNALGTSMPLQVANIVGKERPSMTTFLFIAVAVQVMVFGAWQLYKKRRNSGPKKFL